MYNGEKAFRKIISNASKQFIPHGRIKKVIPNIPTEAAQKIQERDEIRQQDPTSARIQELNQEIDSCVRTHKRDQWRDFISKLDRKSDPGKLFKFFKNINGQPNSSENSAIKFKGKYLTKPLKMADGFNKQYNSIVRHTSSPTSRTISHDLKKNKLADTDLYSPEDTAKAIKRAKASKALGPDGMSNIHLKHLGESGIKYLTTIYNLSMRTSQLPSIIPLPKPSKDPAISSSYRPVSLLCPAIKILERLILPDLQTHLPIPDFQHGFRPKHSTVSALNDLNQDIAAGFNKSKPPHRTILLQIDMSKAFDMVSHDKLLKDLSNSSLPQHLKRWLCCYLKGRQSRVNFRGKTSASRNTRAGVPQGAVTSPILFNFYLTNLPTPPDGVKIIQYADDITIYCSGPILAPLSEKITEYMVSVANFLAERQLLISPEKSTTTLFSPDPAQTRHEPAVLINGEQIKLDRNPKFLGVTLATLHNFTEHIRQTIKKCNNKLNVLKSLAGSSWGQEKETIISTYKTVIRSTLEYAAPIWTPSLCETMWNKMQVVQNKALRIATGCHTMASSAHLHQECNMLPVKDHCILITKQYLAACHLPGHPGQKQLTRPPERRKKKLTLLEYKADVARHIDDSDIDMDEDKYKEILKIIHTEEVTATIQRQDPNRVLGESPPSISKTELMLNRRARSRLSQLRSGFSYLLNSYRHRLDDSVPDTCPLCNASPHDTNHLFTCSSLPTNLTPIDLWRNPTDVSFAFKLEEEVTALRPPEELDGS